MKPKLALAIFLLILSNFTAYRAGEACGRLVVREGRPGRHS